MSEDPRPRTNEPRSCQPLHTVYSLVALLAGVGVLLEQPVMRLFVAPLGVLAAEVRHLARRQACAALRRGTSASRPMAQGPAPATGGLPRPVWTRS